MKIFTIGFTRKTAEQFFALLDRPDLRRVVDIRLNHNSQLAGFTKTADLEFFLRRVLEKGYIHLPQLAPTAEILKAYRDGYGSWDQYEQDFNALMRQRCIQDTVPVEILDGGCLLCSEVTPDHCHRRLVAEYLAGEWRDVEILHLA